MATGCRPRVSRYARRTCSALHDDITRVQFPQTRWLQQACSTRTRKSGPCFCKRLLRPLRGESSHSTISLSVESRCSMVSVPLVPCPPQRAPKSTSLDRHWVFVARAPASHHRRREAGPVVQLRANTDRSLPLPCEGMGGRSLTIWAIDTTGLSITIARSPSRSLMNSWLQAR